MRNTDWFNYGGVYREVELFETPQTVIRDLFLYLDDDGIHVEAAVDGPATQAKLAIPSLDLATTLTLTNGRAQTILQAQPDLWSPENPVLYDVTLSAGGDSVGDRVGFRRIERRGTRILLNGQPVFLRGISVHEDDELQGKLTGIA